ncbi:MAG: NAD(P)/FAD-dependent oxidoreductase, partial [Lachnospiraceae bacterium]|nr:NAD(P)/FAD-dependent oxidoreductase [Lachnospiraceae bacterium]
MEIAVIGGGAAGMMAALTARKCGVDVTIYEKNDRVGKKLLMTGNGKCNFTNLDFSCAYFRSDSCQDKDKQVYFDSFGIGDTLRFFEELGLLVKNRNGYLYPSCEQASAVLDLLRYACDRAGIVTLVQTEVKKLYKKDDKFIIEAKRTDGGHFGTVREEYTSDRVILACGSKAGPKGISTGSGYLFAGSFGHHVI